MSGSDPVGIVGAGPAGLCAAVALTEREIPFEIVDAGERIGGIWDIERAETPMYEAAHFISSRTQSGFRGFPMPDDYPDYPRHDQILRYVQSYAEHHGLTSGIRHGVRVERAEPGTEGWTVRLDSDDERHWSALIVATGTTWHPHWPSVRGRFDGEQMHAFDFRAGDVFRGRKVLIVGGGNSGADIACEAARNAERAFISIRRGYHFIPKYIFGKPADVFAHEGPNLPWRVEELLFGLLVNKLLVGDLRRYGLPRPDHPILRTHPIMNTQILHYLGHGDLEYRPDVAELCGEKVAFVDGDEEEVDLIVWATGYERRFPFMDAQGGEEKLDLYLELFDRVRPDLFFMGLFETDGAAYELFGLQAELVAKYLDARRRTLPSVTSFDEHRRSGRPNLQGGKPYLATLRHNYYVRGNIYERALEKELRALD